MGSATTDVRYGSQADMGSAKWHVRFTPDSNRESGFQQKFMSASPLKADMCMALAHVSQEPEGDMCSARTDVRFTGRSRHLRGV
jgi:hypothetical protein